MNKQNEQQQQPQVEAKPEFSLEDDTPLVKACSLDEQGRPNGCEACQ